MEGAEVVSPTAESRIVSGDLEDIVAKEGRDLAQEKSKMNRLRTFEL